MFPLLWDYSFTVTFLIGFQISVIPALEQKDVLLFHPQLGDKINPASFKASNALKDLFEKSAKVLSYKRNFFFFFFLNAPALADWDCRKSERAEVV